MVAKSKKTPERKAANDAELELLDVNERILKEIHEAYLLAAPDATDVHTSFEPKLAPATLKPSEEGIMAISHKLGLSCIAPRRKINVMIVGNHSAGKSSYIKCAANERARRARRLSCTAHARTPSPASLRG